MKKYGLQLRVPPQKKQPVRPAVAAPLGFNDDDDDDVEREILRQAYKNKTHKDVEDQHKKALEEDPSVFDYDGVYDTMKEEQARPVEKARQDRKPRYIQALLEKTKQREREREVIYERKLAKERSQDEHLYADKDKFVTTAYKRKLAEQQKWMEEERLREMREEKEDVTKKTHLYDFYSNLEKNVAFGGGAGSKKPEKQPEKSVVESSGTSSSPAIGTSSESSTPVERHQDEIPEDIPPKEKSDRPSAKPSSATSTQDQKEVTNEAPSTSNQPKPDHHKRSEDAVAAAKERFLARKKAKV